MAILNEFVNLNIFNIMSQDNVLLSVLIPTKNRSEYLKFAIKSALNIKSSDIEIIVSENYSQDNSLDICHSFADPRLTVVRPPQALPMHENWEFLLNLSRGRWVTFIGDDDAIMPHSVEHLLLLENKFPQAEAIVSPRAYYYWNGYHHPSQYENTVVSFTFNNSNLWIDSKKQLRDVLDGKINYIDLPQMYSGGFHRRSLVNRVKRSQNGIYFKSVTPDAYTALMSCLHTYRYLKTSIPMTWVGSSPRKGVYKDRDADFFGMHTDESLTIHQALGDLRKATFLLYLYEAYISAFPLTSPELLSMEKVKSVFYTSCEELRASGRDDVINKLSQDLGFRPPLRNEEKRHWIFIKSYLFLTKILLRVKNKVVRTGTPYFKKNQITNEMTHFSESYQQYPDILSCDEILLDMYKKCLTDHSNPSV